MVPGNILSQCEKLSIGPNLHPNSTYIQKEQMQWYYGVLTDLLLLERLREVSPPRNSVGDFML